MPADSLLRPARVSVLIVDDHAAVRNAERVLLERRGYSVVGEADCVASALNYVKCLAPDAVLLDIDLPDGNGFELAARIREVAPDVAVLLTSIHFDDCFYAMAQAHGARGFVPKYRLPHVDFASFWPDVSAT
jgi:DNA-binding NarL/FixJ family response regulator